MRFLCPNCHRELEVPDEAAGTAGSCRLCGAAIVAPTLDGRPATLARPAGAPPPPTGAAPGPQAAYGRVQPFDILSEAWRTLWANFGPVAISFYIAAIAMAVGSAIIIGPYIIGVVREASQAPAATAPQLPWYIAAATLLAYVVLAPLLTGPLYVLDGILTRGVAEISDTFRGFQRYAEYAVFYAIYFLPTTLVQVLDSLSPPTAPGEPRIWQFIGFVVTALMATLFLPALMEMVDRGANATEALSASWEFTRGHRWMIFLTWLLLGLVWLAGIVACCVGQFLTVLLLPVGLVLIYRDLRGLSGAPGR